MTTQHNPALPTLPKPETTIVLDGYAAIDALRDLASEHPDRVYEKVPGLPGQPSLCLYQRDGQPDCIIGHVVHRLLPDFDLRLLDAALDYDGAQNTGASNALPWAGLDVPADALQILVDAQDRQDEGNTWADSVRIALGEG